MSLKRFISNLGRQSSEVERSLPPAETELSAQHMRCDYYLMNPSGRAAVRREVGLLTQEARGLDPVILDHSLHHHALLLGQEIVRGAYKFPPERDVSKIAAAETLERVLNVVDFDVAHPAEALSFYAKVFDHGEPTPQNIREEPVEARKILVNYMVNTGLHDRDSFKTEYLGRLQEIMDTQ